MVLDIYGEGNSVSRDGVIIPRESFHLRRDQHQHLQYYVYSERERYKYYIVLRERGHYLIIMKYLQIIRYCNMNRYVSYMNKTVF